MKKAKSVLKNEKGLATLETVPLLFVFLFLFCYTLGAFGAIHTGIKHSIAARAYAFETFRNRTNLTYFRDTPSPDKKHFRNTGTRIHAVMNENRGDTNGFIPSERPIRMGIEIEPLPSRNDVSIHNQKVFEAGELADGKRNQQVEVGPIWIMIQYGICINVNCGG